MPKTGDVDKSHVGEVKRNQLTVGDDGVDEVPTLARRPLVAPSMLTVLHESATTRSEKMELAAEHPACE